MNQTNRKNRNRTSRSSIPTSAPRPDATEAALSLILPPTAFVVLRAYLRIARAVYSTPEMSMREALELMDDDSGFEELELVVGCCVEVAKQRKTARLADWPIKAKAR